MTSSIVANVSLLFADLAVLERFQAARAAGFHLVESWWPFDTASPSSIEVDAFLRAIDEAGVSLVALNLYAGDMAAGERGVLSHPGREVDLQRSLAATEQIAQNTGCALFNALYGLRLNGVSDEAALDVALTNLTRVAAALDGGTLLLEPLSSAANTGYPLGSLDDAERVRSRAVAEGIDSVALLFDSFHLASNGMDLEAQIRDHAEHIAHVQLADDPGRGAPGTGDVDFPGVLRALAKVGYSGHIAAEYIPGPHAVSAEALAAALGADREVAR
ncbi:TIM barrel protein [Microbacterium sp. M28]|uniref:hydroxypyruvate isomerase family protein n=1 Tax=Microbacterium sp. M28 TaxID=2962064 RepID=UPI0021F46E42|nr:TIM barrel protein [Microbacterium sp. M28]UYO97393.1 TIM barrel protein [Microbacterium sp. M28]